jgi:flagellar biosynthesis/type III secretory pathway chaperone
MTEKERHAKITEAVSQIGQLIGTCAAHNMDRGDILTMLQTSTSLFCEVNELPMKTYVDHLYKLHAARMRGEAP